MMKRLTKILTIGVLLIVSLWIIAGCGGNSHNAEIVNKGFEFREQFLQENRTFGSYYIDNEGNRKRVDDEACPKNRTFIINTQVEADVFFSNMQHNFDFTKEMIVIYTFTSTAAISSQFEIKKIDNDSKALIIEFTYETSKSNSDNATSPSQRWLIIKMNKLENEIIKFNKA